MRLSAMAMAGMLLGLAMILSSCGEDGTTAADVPPSAGTVAEPSPEPAARSARRVCRRQLGPFLASMASLRDDLARGLSYEDYLARVKGVRGVYAGIPANRVPAGCLVLSGGPAERAFNLYIDAANAWGDCLATVSCSTRTIEPGLQRKWAQASSRLALAKRGLTPASDG